MTPTFVAPDGALLAPQRNRFFYGKLMDVQHFEQEQAYFRRQQALINRLAIGSGVLTGLNLSAGSGGPGTVRIDAGAALDGAGRPIVVPQAFEIDGHQLTDTSGHPSGSPLTAGFVRISLAYAEATADPIPVMTPHCDAPGDCAPATFLESYLVLVQKDDATAPNYGCRLGKFAPPPDPALLKLLSTQVSGPVADLPADVSVPLGRVNLGDGSVDPFTGRAIVFSNQLLWQAVVCLAQQTASAQGAILRYVSGDNQAGTNGKPLGAPLVVELVDTAGNPVAGSLVQFKPGNAGTANPASAATDKSGRAQTTWTLDTAAADQTLTAGAVGSPLSVTFRAKASKG